MVASGQNKPHVGGDERGASENSPATLLHGVSASVLLDSLVGFQAPPRGGAESDFRSPSGQISTAFIRAHSSS